MADQAVISLRNVSKKYQLYESMKHRLYEALHPFNRAYHREFWALRDITVDIPRGATVGILGVNGSGKSTLLQIICSILQPTGGSVEVRGRVAALIELGAGFNPDLTGRQNAEINSIIMGLDGRVARARLTEIQAFADIGEFFDQPVKTYSSGMFMRVAFATAINVAPDILVIDEALAVGDARFQQKCFRKFREFQDAGKTIILVTHDRFTIPRLCSFAMLLDHGRLLLSGDPKEVTDRYSELLTHGSTNDLPNRKPAEKIEAREIAEALAAAEIAEDSIMENFLTGADTKDRCPLNPAYNKNEFCFGLGGAEIIDFLLIADGKPNQEQVQSGRVLDLYMRIRFDQDVDSPIVGITVKSRDGTLIYGINSAWMKQKLSPRSSGETASYKFSVRMDLGPGDWFIDLAVARTETEILHTREGVVHVRTDPLIFSTGFASLGTSLSEI